MKFSPIAVFGGANIEYILKSKSDIIQGSKNFVDIEELFGGGGLNYAMRLIATGRQVYPLLYLGNDSIGKSIQAHLLSHCDRALASYSFIESDDFFVDGLNTIRSMIIVEGHHRTILAQDQNNTNLFLPHLKSLIDTLPDMRAVAIGHIHNDRRDINDINELSTKYIIDHYREEDALIYANFGATQLEYGFSFWKECLRHTDILQLNFTELKSFFIADDNPLSLFEILEFFGDINLSAIITLDKFGAIGFVPDAPHSIFMARPVDLGDDFVDSTGAGDAFCAGMLSILHKKKSFTHKEFKTAMEMARSWAVYACKSYGGANHCPSRDEINAFHAKINEGNSVIEYSGERMKDIVSLIDSTFEA